MLRALRKRWHKRTRTLVFYASSWIDELWVRTTIEACCKRKVKPVLLLGSENALSRETKTLYQHLGVPVHEGQGIDELRAQKAHLVVTATTGVGKDWFHPEVNYLIHMPHSLASLHMIYPADTFDGYDILFAAGPHHEKEFCAIAAARNLHNRHSYPVGYGKLDLLRAEASLRCSQANGPVGQKKHILLAPSWGPGNILQEMGKELVAALLQKGHTLTLRPHPSFFLDNNEIVGAIAEEHKANPRFILEHATGLGDAMFHADMLISDYSGSALEFVALRNRPVLFIDVPKKIVNPQWTEVGLLPVELGMRTLVGSLVPAELQPVCAAIDAMDICKEQGKDMATPFCYHDRHCGETAAQHIESFLEE